MCQTELWAPASGSVDWEGVQWGQQGFLGSFSKVTQLPYAATAAVLETVQPQKLLFVELSPFFPKCLFCILYTCL